MSRRRFAIRFAIWLTHMGYPCGVAMARTNEQTNATDARYQDQADDLLFLMGPALWISRISRQEVTA